jgi:hypothetical protein
MTLIMILNAIFWAFVLFGIVGLHLWAIATSRPDAGARKAMAREAARPGPEPRVQPSAA